MRRRGSHGRPLTAGATGAKSMSSSAPLKLGAARSTAASRRRKSNTVMLSGNLGMDAPIQGFLGRQGAARNRPGTADGATGNAGSQVDSAPNARPSSSAAGSRDVAVSPVVQRGLKFMPSPFLLKQRGRLPSLSNGGIRKGSLTGLHSGTGFGVRGAGSGAAGATAGAEDDTPANRPRTSPAPGAANSGRNSPYTGYGYQQQQQQQSQQSQYGGYGQQLQQYGGSSYGQQQYGGGYGQQGLHHAPASAAQRRATVTYGVSSVKGRRPYMEDEYTVVDDMDETCGAVVNVGSREPNGERTSFYGVFDGHAGRRCARAVSRTVANNVFAEAAFPSDLPQAIVAGFRATEDAFIETARRYNMPDGTTAITVFRRGNTLWTANVGDSRAVLSSRGTAVALSTDHKPNAPSERKRINALGGRVVQCFGVFRVNGILAVSRAFGDASLKPYVSAEPDLTRHELDEGDEFMILASDGLWDVLGNQEAVDLVRRFIDSQGLHACAKKLTDRALRKGSMDNTTALVVDLRSGTGVGGGTGELPSQLSGSASAPALEQSTAAPSSGWGSAWVKFQQPRFVRPRQ